jgi:hypothetical protein
MRGSFALWLIGLSALSPGCALVTDATRLVAYQTSRSWNEHKERSRNRRWAEAAWEEVQAATPNHPYSADYAQGFKDGFETYLYQGGTGEPPPVAPPRYRTLRYQTPQGYQAIQDWFAGYRHGADVAHRGGYRQWVTGPTSLRCLLPLPEQAPECVRIPQVEPPGEEVLPPPKLGKAAAGTPADNGLSRVTSSPYLAPTWRRTEVSCGGVRAVRD